MTSWSRAGEPLEAPLPPFVPTPLPGDADAFVPATAGDPFAPPEPEPDPAAASAAAEPAPDGEALLRQAYEEGRAAGRAELPPEQAERLERAGAALEAAARALEARADSLRRAFRESTLELAVAIAEFMLRRSIQADLDALAPLVEEGLELLEASAERRILLSTRDHATLSEHGAPLLEQLAEREQVRIEVDAALAPGDLRVEAGAACVDGRLAELVARVRGELARLLDVETGA